MLSGAPCSFQGSASLFPHGGHGLQIPARPPGRCELSAVGAVGSRALARPACTGQRRALRRGADEAAAGAHGALVLGWSRRQGRGPLCPDARLLAPSRCPRQEPGAAAALLAKTTPSLRGHAAPGAQRPRTPPGPQGSPQQVLGDARAQETTRVVTGEAKQTHRWRGDLTGVRTRLPPFPEPPGAPPSTAKAAGEEA